MKDISPSLIAVVSAYSANKWYSTGVDGLLSTSETTPLEDGSGGARVVVNGQCSVDGRPYLGPLTQTGEERGGGGGQGGGQGEGVEVGGGNVCVKVG